MLIIIIIASYQLVMYMYSFAISALLLLTLTAPPNGVSTPPPSLSYALRESHDGNKTLWAIENTLDPVFTLEFPTQLI